jgi:hypothetical protein
MSLALMPITALRKSVRHVTRRKHVQTSIVHHLDAVIVISTHLIVVAVHRQSLVLIKRIKPRRHWLRHSQVLQTHKDHSSASQKNNEIFAKHNYTVTEFNQAFQTKVQSQHNKIL